MGINLIIGRMLNVIAAFDTVLVRRRTAGTAILHPSKRKCVCRGPRLFAAALAAALFLSSPAAAALGGSLASVDDDQKQLQCVRRSTQVNGSYSVYELQTGSGTVIREYVTPAGTVFGLAWEGPSLPNMRQILGSFYGQFEQIAGQRRQAHQRGPLVIEEPGLVVYSGGHMRAYSGKAFVPGLVPAGVRTEDIR